MKTSEKLEKKIRRLAFLLIVLSGFIVAVGALAVIRGHKIEKLETENAVLLERNQILSEKIHRLQIGRKNQENYSRSLKEKLLVRDIEISGLKLNNKKMTSILEAMQAKLEETTNCCDGDFVPYIIEKLKEFRKFAGKVGGEK